MSLSGKYWPIHPNPLSDELFSSWLTRVALGNSPRTHTFCNTVWPEHQIWTRDIDVNGYEWLAPKLSKRTNTNKEIINTLGLGVYEGIVLEKLNHVGSNSWILPVGVYHRKRKRFGLQWCPICLASDKTPYYRRHWRMAFNSCCIRHGIILADRCHICHSPAIPFRRGICICYKCGADLRKHPCIPAEIEAITAEQMLTARALDGRTMLPTMTPIFSIAYFSIWHHLLNHVAFGKRSTQMRAAIAKQYGGNPKSFRNPLRHEFEYLSAKERNQLMGLVCRLFHGWPWRLIGVAHASRSWASYILSSQKPACFALWHPLRKFASGQPLHHKNSN